jgi:hypothetical protein
MTAIANHPHRVTSAVAAVRAELTSVAGVPVWSMDRAETAATLAELKSLAGQVAELQARVLVHADRSELACHGAATSTAHWYAVTTQATRARAHRLIRLAHGLDTHEPTRAALAEGRVNTEQAEVILSALGELPDDLDPELATQAEAHLVELGADHDAKALRTLGRRILEVVSPETADAHEAKLLDREERAAAAATRLTMWEDGHGRVHGRFTRRGDRCGVEEGAVRDRRPQTPGQPRRSGRAAADAGAARAGVHRVRAALPHPQTPEGRVA